MFRVVLDTVVFVRALINPRSRNGRILFDHSDQYRLLISKPVAQEVLEVLHRPEMTRKYHHLSTVSMRRVLDYLAKAEAVEIRETVSVVRDPKDNIFVATALAGRADYIVSEDKDLLDLGDSTGVSIVDSATFIALLES